MTRNPRSRENEKKVPKILRGPPYNHLPRCSMGLAYLPTKLGSFGGFHVGKYTSPIEHLGLLHEKIKPKN